MILMLPLIGTRLSSDRGDENDPVRPLDWADLIPAPLPAWHCQLIDTSLDLENGEAQYLITAVHPQNQTALDALLDAFDQDRPGVGSKRALQARDYVDLVRMRRVRPDSRVEPLGGR